ITREELNARVYFHTPFRISASPAGAILTSSILDVYAPDVFIDVDAEGQILAEAEALTLDRLRSEGWEPVSGYSSQHGYRGPIMHTSETLGGGMAQEVIDTPGVYVLVPVECVYPDGEQDD